MKNKGAEHERKLTPEEQLEVLQMKKELAQKTTPKYNELFNSIDQGFCTITLKYDENDRPVDYQFIEVSPSFEYHTGIKDAAGKWMRDIATDQDEFWFETYGRIAKDRKSERFEYFSTPLNRWWSVYAFPINEEESKQIGVLFNNITEQVKAKKRLEESEMQFRNVLLQSPNIFVILKGFPEMIITFANEPLFKSWGRTAAIIGKPLLEVLPEIKDQPFPKLMQGVFETGETYYSSEEKAVIIKNGIPVDTYYIYVYQPIFDDHQKVTSVTVMATDITEQVLARKRLEESEKRYSTLLMESPFAVGILKGKDMVVSLANDAIKKLWGKGSDVEGKSLLSLMPEIKEQGFAALLDDVYTTGKPFYGHELLVKLQRNGIWENTYFNFVYQPYKEADGTISGVTIIANEVTTQAIANKKIAASQQNVSRLFMQAPALICVFRGPQHVYELANEMYLQFISNRDIVGKPVREAFPELKGQGFYELLDNVYETGQPFIGNEIPVKLDKGTGRLEQIYVNFVYQPSRNNEGEIDGILLHGVDVTEQVLGRKTIEESEEKYRTLFNSMDEGFCIIKLIYNENGQPIDYCYLEVNKSYERLTGLKNAVGKYAHEIVPNLEEIWLKTLDKVVQTGEIIRFEEYNAFIGRWYSVFAFSAGEVQQNGVAILFNDITERKNAERKQAFLLKLSDELRPLKEPVAIQEAAMKLLAEELDVMRATYIDVKADGDTIEFTASYEKDAPPFPAITRISDFTPAHVALYHSGQTLILCDTETEPQPEGYRTVGVRAAVGVPLVKNGQVVSIVGVNSASPRNWTAIDVQILEELAERTWAAVERAKAERTLHYSEERLRLATQASDIYWFEYDFTTNTTIYSSNTEHVMGAAPAKTLEENLLLLHTEDRELPAQAFEEAIKKGNTHFNYVVRSIAVPSQIRWLEVSGQIIRDNQNKPMLAIGISQNITERRQAEEALRDAEEKYRNELELEVLQRTTELKENKDLLQTVFDASPNSISVFEILYNDAGAVYDFKILIFNAFTIKTIGGRNVIGQNYSEAFPHVVETGVLNELIKAATTGEQTEFEKWYQGEGMHHWFRFIVTKIGTRLLVTTEDITKRKNAEEEIKTHLTLLKQSEDLAQLGSWEYEIATGKFIWSDGMYELFGLPKGINVRPEIYLDHAVDEERYIAERILQGFKKPQAFDETLCIKRAGSVREIKIKASIVADEKGGSLKLVGVDLDITEAKQSEKTLREQAHFIQSTNEALPDILSVINIETNQIVYINHSFEERLGYTDEQIQNMNPPFFGILYQEDIAGVLAHFEEMKGASDGEVCEVEYRIKAADGSLHWFRDRNAVFKRDKAGVPIEKIGIAQDITERKKVEQELKESNISLRYANENLQQFASIASHDLQEPLRKIKLFISVLEKNWTDLLPAEGKDIIRKITNASDRMSQLIREVLQYSKIAYGEKEFIPVDLHQILQNVMSDLDLLLEDSGAAVDYPGPMPVIEAIPLQMHQLFYNLLTNAVKFRTKGEGLAIRISAGPVPGESLKRFPDSLPEKSYTEIVVSDNGIGFEQEYADQIFQIFERLHSIEDYEGTGVGLALCKKIVENHSGNIFAVSTEGNGAAFHILLPVKQ